MKVAVAMSGGVDSSVAAALLKQQGHEVCGVTMRAVPETDTTAASEAARFLDIPHHVFDLTEIFDRLIISHFCGEYEAGRTPNPCVRCNELIKFGALLEKALETGAEYLATGHHARTEKDAGGYYLLKKGRDRRKDQSYFLCRLSQQQLKRALFPVGGMTKDKVKEIARELGLPAVARPESQEICFIPDGDYTRFLKEHAVSAAVPGPIIDGSGNILGRHRGISSYTVGQRKGLGIVAAAPLYVTAIEPDRNAVIVGTKEQTCGSDLVAGDINWIAVDRPDQPLKVKARVRYRHPEAEAVILPVDRDNIYVKFTEPQAAIAPGQTIVFYDGDTVLGGGTIIRQGS